jgi:hypothetical protein
VYSIEDQCRSAFPNGLDDLTKAEWVSLEILVIHDALYEHQPIFIGEFSGQFGKRMNTYGSRATVLSLHKRGMAERHSQTRGVWAFWNITPKGKLALKYRELFMP